MTPRRAAFAWVAEVIDDLLTSGININRAVAGEMSRIRDAMRAASEVEDVPQECPQVADVRPSRVKAGRGRAR